MIAVGTITHPPRPLSGAKPAGRRPNPSSERARQPWIAQGVSRRTFYRRKPRQHSAHVVAWYRQAGGIEQLEYRSMMRRSVSNAAGRIETSSTDIMRLYMRALGVS